MRKSSEQLCFNGVCGATGAYLHPPLTAPELVASLDGIDGAVSPGARRRRQRHDWLGPHLIPRDGHDPTDLASAGWGVIFAEDTDPEIRDALDILLQHRREQASQYDPRFYRELWGEEGYRAGESRLQFFTRHRVGPGAADPRRLPYYLLLVGDPTRIPYTFQHLLDIEYAVGRIAFDTAEEYHAYARGVVAAERAASASTRVVLAAARHPGDRASELATAHLVGPLARYLGERRLPWRIETALGDDAAKASLLAQLGGATSPALLFAAVHGVGFPLGDHRQRTCQGALLCQDWPGPDQWRGPVPADHYIAAHDIDDDACLEGSILFFFTCHGLGTPRLESCGPDLDRPLTPEPFVARLAQRLLTLPRGGALALAGHVGRCWGYSFLWQDVGVHTQLFEDAMLRLLAPRPIGYALELFNQRHAELMAEIQELRLDPDADPSVLGALWTAAQDARNYVIFGDPAVRLAAPSELPEINSAVPDFTLARASRAPGRRGKSGM